MKNLSHAYYYWTWLPTYRFGTPYTKENLGNPRCKYQSEVGYASSKKSNYWVKCKEDCPSETVNFPAVYVSGMQVFPARSVEKWRETGSHCKRTCGSIEMTEDSVLESCNNRRIERNERAFDYTPWYKPGQWGCDSGYKAVYGVGTDTGWYDDYVQAFPTFLITLTFWFNDIFRDTLDDFAELGAFCKNNGCVTILGVRKLWCV